MQIGDRYQRRTASGPHQGSPANFTLETFRAYYEQRLYDFNKNMKHADIINKPRGFMKNHYTTKLEDEMLLPTGNGVINRVQRKFMKGEHADVLEAFTNEHGELMTHNPYFVEWFLCKFMEDQTLQAAAKASLEARKEKAK